MPEVESPDEARQEHRALWSGYAYLALAGAATLLLAPLYLRLLGPEAWGTVAFCLSVQGLLFGLDAMLGPLLLREAARAASPADARAVFAAFLRRYALLAAGLCLLLQPVLAWGPLPPSVPVSLLRLALVQFLFQFTNLAIAGYWQGRGEVVRANARLSFFLVMRHAVALVLVLAWQAEALVLVLAFALVAALEVGANLWRARHELSAGRSAEPAPGSAAALPAAFVVAGLAAMFGTHLDRLWLAFTLPASRFGVYFLLGSLLLSLLHLQMPIQRAFLPRIAAAPTPGAALRRMRRATAIVWLPALALALVAAPFLSLWLGPTAVDGEAVAAFVGLMCAAILLTLASPAQALLLRAARYRALATISVVALAAQAAALALATGTLGMRAGALAWGAAGIVQWLGAELALRRS